MQLAITCRSAATVEGFKWPCGKKKSQKQYFKPGTCLIESRCFSTQPSYWSALDTTGGRLYWPIFPRCSSFVFCFKFISKPEQAAQPQCFGISYGINTPLRAVSKWEAYPGTFNSCSLWTDLLENQWCEYISSTSLNINLKSLVEGWHTRVLRSETKRHLLICRTKKGLRW